jgi:hypothetical protein
LFNVPAKEKVEVTSLNCPMAGSSCSSCAIWAVLGLCIHLQAGRQAGGRAGRQDHDRDTTPPFALHLLLSCVRLSGKPGTTGTARQTRLDSGRARV